MTIEMYAYLDTQGTAMSETAICAHCLGNSARAAEAALATAQRADDWNGLTLEECSGNNMLQCTNCGAGGLDRSSLLDDLNQLYLISVRGYNILRREAVNTVGDFADLQPSRMWEMRGMTAKVYDELRDLQKIVAPQVNAPEPGDDEKDADDVRAQLIQFLLDEGLAEAHYGFGHASADQVADKLLEKFTITGKDNA